MLRVRASAYPGEVDAGSPTRICASQSAYPGEVDAGAATSTTRICARQSGCAGFTLIEVLVALAVVGASLAAIGELVSVSMRGTQLLERRVAFRETLRSIVTSVSDRRELAPGSATGHTAGYAWRMDVAPYRSTLVDPQAPTRWQPEAVEITVRSPSGQILRVDTIRLRRRPG